MTFSSVSSKKNVSFTGLRESIKSGQKVVGQFQKEFPGLQSNTLVQEQIRQYGKVPFFKGLFDPHLKMLKKMMRKAVNKVCTLEDDVQGYMETKTRHGEKKLEYLPFIEILKKAVKEKCAANCGRRAEIIQNKHLLNGEEAHNVNFVITKRGIEGCRFDTARRDHSFTLTNTPDRIDFTKPETWSNAVISDAWVPGSLVEKAVNPKMNGKNKVVEYGGSLQKLLDFFGFNPKTEQIRFMNSDSNSVKEFMQNIEICQKVKPAA